MEEKIPKPAKKPRKTKPKKQSGPPPEFAHTATAKAAGPPQTLPIAGGGLATFETIPDEPLEWLIPGLIPRGELVLCAGPSECGKSTFFASVIAHVTGACSFNGLDLLPPSRALLFALEESAGGAPKERLCSAGADLSRVASGDRLPDNRPAPLPYLPDMMPQLRQRVEGIRASLVIIDPLSSLLGPGFSVNDGQHVRSVLHPLQDLARSRGISVLYTLHYRKSTTGDASNWVSGHKDWWNVPRHILAFGRDPRQQDRYVLAVAKQSRGKKVQSLSYKISEVRGGAWFEPLGQTGTTARDLGCDLDDEITRSTGSWHGTTSAAC